MNAFTRCVLALLLLGSCGFSAEVLPSAGKAVGIIRDDTPGSWAVVAQDFSPVDVKEFDGDEVKGWLGCYFEGPSGRYLAIKSGGNKLKTFAVVLGGVAPTPIPPPGPTPVPPDPTPVPPPAPVTGPIRAMIVYETEHLGQYTRDQLAVLDSGYVVAYLKAHCAASSTGIPEYRIWDDDYKPSEIAVKDSTWLRTYDAAKADSKANTPNSVEPWLLIEQKGKTVYSGQVTTEAATLDILKKFGGP